MAGIVEITEKTFSGVKKITFDWTASATTGSTGKASATTTGYYDGQVLRIVSSTNNSTGGWDLQLNDSNGIDMLGGQGINMSSGTVYDFGTSTGGTSNWSPLSVVSGTVALEISKATTGSIGRIIVYIR